MNDQELSEAYALAARPYLEAEGPVNWNDYLHLRSWRYVFEVSSACNLRCTLCHAGNRPGYAYNPGIMEWGMMLKILDKIASENPRAVVCAYVNSEPLLHPRMPEVIREIKQRGLNCEIATNLNVMNRVDEVIAAKPDLFTVSVSGWTQPVYERAHRGGDIEVVKQNIVRMAEIWRATDRSVKTGISYHVYRDNQGEEMEQMRVFAHNLGLMFLTSWGRVITMENTIQALRQLDPNPVQPYEVKAGQIDLNRSLPPPNEDFIKGMERLQFHPARAREFYARWPVAPVCLISEVFTEIRHDGRVQLCAWTDDMRLTLGNYLEMSPEEIRQARRGHPLCQECLKYRMNLYFHIVDRPGWSMPGS